jgi:hypothetical protein
MNLVGPDDDDCMLLVWDPLDDGREIGMNLVAVGPDVDVVLVV